MRKIVFSTLTVMAATVSFGAELVTNGDFEATPPDLGWTVSGTTIIGDWSGSVVSSAGNLGPPTNTAWLGGVNGTDDQLRQTVTSVNGGTATFSFDLFYTNEDGPNFDLFLVYLDSVLIYSQDLGDSFPVTLYGPNHISVDVSDQMDGGSKDILFEVLTDGSLPCSAFVDNVSIQTAVPEPASLTALGLGALAVLRRRKK